MLSKAKIWITIITLTIIALAEQPLSAQFHIYIPSTQHPIVPGKEIRIFFENPTYYAVDLYYSTDNGTTWQTIAKGIKWNYYDWTVPFFEELHFLLKATLRSYTQPTELFSIENAHSGEIRTVQFHRNSRYLLSASTENKIKIWDLWNKNTIDSLILPKDKVLYTATFGNKDLDVIFAMDSSVYYWQTSSSYYEIPELRFSKIVRALAVDETNGYLAVGSYDGTMRIYDLEEKQVVAEFTTRDTLEIYCVRFSKDGNYVGCSGWKGLIEVWNWRNNTKIAELSGHGDPYGANLLVWSFDFSNDNNYIVSGGIDKSVRYWNISTQKEIYSLLNHFAGIRTVKYYPKANYYMSAGLDSLLYQYEAEDGTRIENPLKARFQIISADYSSTGDTISAGGRHNTITFWKNFKTEEISDTILVNIQYPATIQILNIEGEAGDRVPVAFTMNTSPYLQGKFTDSYSAEMNIVVPEEFLYIPADNPNIVQKQGDTIKLSLQNVKFGDTLNFLSAVLKPSKNEYGNIKIIDFSLKSEIPFSFDKYDGTIRLLESRNNPEIKIYPNPIYNKAKIEIIIYKRGTYSLKLYDDRGALVHQFFCDDFERGFYEFYYDFSQLAPSAYYFVYTRFGEMKIIPIILIR